MTYHCLRECATDKASDQAAHTGSLISLCKSLEYSMTFKLRTEHHFGVSKLKRRLHRLVRVNTCQKAILLEITSRLKW